ncbi:(deoxy)nucleoside triphosphate pyrophosphohydrolase [Rothia mucilaginosa]|uniref:(deoxy)nucleoside triphosphate pyrophosphohydrolase n=1 Tax=Rothia sp. RSM407 TaxID=3398581 RepID=UPI002449331A|nr:(deoxy)nucleoside triphosphate pyrophosphohydrolase [uncultured Rothia sp.]
MSTSNQVPEHFEVQVVGAAVLDSFKNPSRLLIAQRSAPPILAGLWEFPGGKVEAAESCEQALARELSEELGVRILVGAEVPGPHVQGWPLNERLAMRVFFAEIFSGTPDTLEDHSALRWMPLPKSRDDAQAYDDLLGLPWIPADLPIVVALLQQLQDAGVGEV